MKKIFLLVAFALVVSAASAWHKNADAGMVVLATKHLTPEAKSVVEKHLGTAYEDDCGYIYYLERKKKSPYSKDVHFLHLDKNLQPANIEGDDALVALEKAMELLSNRESYSDAKVKETLRCVINLMCDIHNFSNIRIESVPHSYTDYSFMREKNEYVKTDYITYKWKSFWYKLSGSLAVFHPELWAEDMELCHGGKYAEMTKGTLRDWAADNGTKAAGYYAKIYPDAVITLREYLHMDFANYDIIACAGFRLAALLNETIK